MTACVTFRFNSAWRFIRSSRAQGVRKVPNRMAQNHVLLFRFLQPPPMNRTRKDFPHVRKEQPKATYTSIEANILADMKSTWRYGFLRKLGNNTEQLGFSFSLARRGIMLDPVHMWGRSYRSVFPNSESCDCFEGRARRNFVQVRVKFTRFNP